MAQRIQILCINKSDRQNSHERIRNIGGVANGQRWKESQENAIAGIERGDWKFFVKVGYNEVDVIVAKSQFGNKYIKTTNDGEQPNNLLSLPECPN